MCQKAAFAMFSAPGTPNFFLLTLQESLECAFFFMLSPLFIILKKQITPQTVLVLSFSTVAIMQKHHVCAHSPFLFLFLVKLS